MSESDAICEELSLAAASVFGQLGDRLFRASSVRFKGFVVQTMKKGGTMELIIPRDWLMSP